MLSTLWQYAFAVSVWPGLLGGAALGWLYLWIVRKLSARMQGRQGPPFYQPFFDFVKLLGKETVVPGAISRGLFVLLPIASRRLLPGRPGALAVLPRSADAL